MRKTDKKLDNQLRLLLTQVCEKALKEVNGFQWLTHTVNYNCFPQSLKIIFVFDTNENLEHYLCSDDKSRLAMLVQQIFNAHKLHGINISKQTIYDTEENCENQHSGNWSARLS